MKKGLLLVMGMMVITASCRKSSNDSLISNQTGVNKNTPAERHSRPFKGRIDYAFTTDFDLPCDCGSYTAAGNYYGTGNFTELGLTTSKIKPCTSPLYGSAPSARASAGSTTQPTGPLPASPFTGTVIGNKVGVECASFVAANGDILYLSIRPYNLIFGATACVGTCWADIVGGTGRFVSATGSFSGTVTVPFVGGTASFTDVNGTIEY